MKFKVLFSYSTSVVPPRCRKPRTVVHHDGVAEVEILEIDQVTAPVGIRLKSKQWVNKGAGENPDHVDTSIDYRWFGGELWTNCRMFNCTRSSHTSRQNDWAYERPPAVVDLRSDNGCRASHYRLHLELSPFTPREKVEEYLKRWASGWLIIKGKSGMWAPSGEPRYVVMTFGLGCNHGGTALMLDSSYNSNISKDSYYSALQRTDAIAAATATAKSRGDLKSLPIKPQGSIQVLIPEAVRCKPQEEAGEGDPFINNAETIISAVKNPAMAAFALLGAVMS